MNAKTARKLLGTLSGLLLATSSLPAQALAPNDLSVSGNLQLWLTDAAANFDGTTWSDVSGNGRDASPVGLVNVNGPVTYVAPTLNAAANTIDANTSAVLFAGDVDDLLRSSDLNGDAGMSELTIFSVYNLIEISGSGNDASDANLTRPVGIGSIAGTQINLGNYFNLASDPSVRKDNGSIAPGNYGGATLPAGSFIRISRMDANGVDEWFNTSEALNPVLTDFTSAAGTGVPYTTSVDDFFLGDLREGATTVPGFGANTITSIFEISQVIVYNGSLTDAQVAGINNWIVTVPEPSTYALLLGVGGLLLARLRRRRGR